MTVCSIQFGMALLGDRQGKARRFSTQELAEAELKEWQGRQTKRLLKTIQPQGLAVQTGPQSWVLATNTAVSGIGSDRLVNAVAEARLGKPGHRLTVPGFSLPMDYSTLSLLQHTRHAFQTGVGMQPLPPSVRQMVATARDPGKDLNNHILQSVISEAAVLPDWPDRQYR